MGQSPAEVRTVIGRRPRLAAVSGNEDTVADVRRSRKDRIILEQQRTYRGVGKTVIDFSPRLAVIGGTIYPFPCSGENGPFARQ